MNQQQRVQEIPNSEEYRRQLIRMSKYGKIFGDFADGNNGRCAVGAIVSELGWDGSNFDKPWSDVMGSIQLHAIHLGVNIVNDNDNNGLSWEEIADKLEKVGL